MSPAIAHCFACQFMLGWVVSLVYAETVAEGEIGSLQRCHDYTKNCIDISGCGLCTMI